jgi:hypothetical protein
MPSGKSEFKRRNKNNEAPIRGRKTEASQCLKVCELTQGDWSIEDIK